MIDIGLRAKKSPLERHHLFPKAFLIREGITEQRDTNQIANYALIEWQDNIAISDKAPTEYLGDYLKRFSKDQVEKMYYWHALPAGWQNMKYADFLEERRKLMAQVIRDGFEALLNENTSSKKWWSFGKK